MARTAAAEVFEKNVGYVDFAGVGGAGSFVDVEVALVKYNGRILRYQM